MSPQNRSILQLMKKGNLGHSSRFETVDPKTNTFAKGKPGKVVFDGQSKPTEGPEVIQLIGQNTWYIYGDPFRSPMEAWETTDFIKFKKIAVKTVPGSKHCSMLPITKTELRRLLDTYPANTPPASVEVLLPHAKQKPSTWRYTFEQPTAHWFKSEFNDSHWRSGQGGFCLRQLCPPPFGLFRLAPGFIELD